jgi:hypothetical protein
MTEDMNTKDLSDRELLELLRRDLVLMHQDFNTRLEKLEARTNPLPPNYDARFTALESDVKELKREMKMLRKHDFQREVELNDVIERVEVLEEKTAA